MELKSIHFYLIKNYFEKIYNLASLSIFKSFLNFKTRTRNRAPPLRQEIKSLALYTSEKITREEKMKYR
ncbi:hypothetical protein D1632_01815 [Chryseobacterium nematophagum]|uniref:Uncharacterized protein n=1 Tax=Chryseobacterium nematophagum TaxID=2305228 RepID=A0A3M7LFB0_9FLAO|nr:hypothetical protein D1632_01815 [Chryseobacterium nematophagum]